MEKSRSVQIAKAHSRAKTILTQRHRDEFKEILAQVYAEHGLTVRQRLTKADKAKAMEDLKNLKAEGYEG